MPFVDGMLLSWAVLAIILVVSTVTYHLIEAPGIKFGKWLGAKLIKL